MKTRILYLLLITGTISYGCEATNKVIPGQEITPKADVQEMMFNGTLKVLTLNTWQEGTSVDGGFKDCRCNCPVQSRYSNALRSEGL